MDIVTSIVDFLGLQGLWRWIAGAWLLLIVLLFFSRQRDRAWMRRTSQKADTPYAWLKKRVMQGVPALLLPKTAEEDPRPVSGFWDKLFWDIEPHSKDDADTARLRDNPWSWPVLDKAILIAAMYPVMFSLTQWGFFSGSETDLAGMPLFSGDVPGWARYTLFGLLTLFLLSRVMAAATSKPIYEVITFLMISSTGIAAMAVGLGRLVANETVGGILVSIAGVGGLSVTFALLLVGTLSVVPFGGFAGGLVIGFTAARAIPSLSLAIELGVFLLVAYPTTGLVYKLSRVTGSILPHLTMISFGLVIGVWSLSSGFVDNNELGIVFAFGFLAFVNAPFDWLSYGATLYLLREGFRRGGRAQVFYGLVDLAAAALLFFTLSLALMAGIVAINTFSETPLIDLGVLLAELRLTPEKHLWVIAMVASTLLPTLLHLAIATVSLTLWVPSELWRRGLDGLEQKDSLFVPLGAAVALSAFTAVYFLLPPLILGFTGYLLWINGAILREGYIDAMVRVAHGLGLL